MSAPMSSTSTNSCTRLCPPGGEKSREGAERVAPVRGPAAIQLRLQDGAERQDDCYEPGRAFESRRRQSGANASVTAIATKKLGDGAHFCISTPLGAIARARSDGEWIATQHATDFSKSQWRHVRRTNRAMKPLSVQR
jgi:hypothetical protein